MATSKTEICNLALTHLGSGKEIANIDTEESDEASAMRRVYTTALSETLRDFNWPFATRFVDLGLVESNPTDEWAYSYRYPSEAIKIRRILSGNRLDSLQSKVPYKIAADDQGKLIYTDAQDATLEYTKDETDTSRFSPDFVMALSYKLGALSAARITNGDQYRLGDKCANLYRLEVSKAAVNAFNEEGADLPKEAEFISARES